MPDRRRRPGGRAAGGGRGTGPAAVEAADDEDDRPSRRRSAEDEDRDERPSKPSRRGDEEEDEDRPRRRSRQDEEDERPSRRRSRWDGDDSPRSAARQLNVCGLIGLIVGIPSILINFLACCGGWIPGLIGGVISLALGVIGLVLAKKSEGRMSGGLAIAGTILGGIAVLFSVLWMALFAT